MIEIVIFSWVFAFVIIAYVCTKRKLKRLRDELN